MLKIAHRGNTEGSDFENENNPIYIDKAIDKGFDSEIDVWLQGRRLYLGHDEPTYQIELDYLKNNNLWCHAKNIDALNQMTQYSNIHSFWHQEDDVTLTSCGFMWTYPEKTVTDTSIAVLIKKNSKIPKKVLGICSDYVVTYKNKSNRRL